ncbi:pentatricopeptide repeat-containing protein at5g10690 [Phtheirospermum japonicum]|uniref:Pentatricopeptide repeat-containing protein at5g10690 n=1 Tax=Phtheirospermum japonicum TaxID=374723 RepID=A0A830BF68_9LAMI|nr:pentatricopeptide repeat-containing protein at5g10690 [Phtheirospermum japonicum]
MSAALAAPILLPRPTQFESSHFPRRSAHAPPTTCSDCVHCHDIDCALKVFDEMSKPEGCAVDEVTYGTLLKGLGDARRIDEAFQVLESVEKGTATGSPQ